MNDTTKHTAGPWDWVPTGVTMSDDYKQPFGVIQMLDDGPILIAGVFGDIPGGHDAAMTHARLLAASPRLLAALQAIMLKAVCQQAAGGDIMDFQDRLRESADIARAAIAQALGTDG